MLTHEITPAFRVGVYLFIPPTAIGSVPSLSGHAITYRLRSLPRVRWHRARALSFQTSPWSNECAPISPHAPYWYEVDMYDTGNIGSGVKPEKAASVTRITVRTTGLVLVNSWRHTPLLRNYVT